MMRSVQTYRPSGRFDATSTILAGIGGAALAALVGFIAFAGVWVDLPHLLIVNSALQGAVVAGMVALLFRKAKLRNPAIAVILAVLCGAVSVATFFTAEYVRSAYRWRDTVARQFAPLLEQTDAAGKARIRAALAHPLEMFDRLLLGATGHRGVIGYVILQNHLGVRMTDVGEGPPLHPNGQEITGAALYVLWSVEALLVIVPAAWIARIVTRKPFCEKCNRWMPAPGYPLMLPVHRSGELLDALRSGDPKRILALHPIEDFDAGRGSATVELRRCTTCDFAVADVAVKSNAHNSAGATKPIAGLIVDRPMVEALRTKPANIASPSAEAADEDVETADDVPDKSSEVGSSDPSPDRAVEDPVL